VQVEIKTTTAILQHLKKIDDRKLYAEMNCDSLFTYCTKVLRYSESQAHRRITAARLLGQIPDLDKKIENGTLTLTNIVQAQSFFLYEKRAGRPLELERKIEILARLENQPTREAERILIAEHPEDRPIDRESIRFITPSAIELKFILDPELLRKLTRIKVLLGHRFPLGNWADIINEICDETLERIDPLIKAERARERSGYVAEERHVAIGKTRQRDETENTAKPARTWISTATRSRVWKRDGGRCVHIDPKSGLRCNSTLRIEIDHIRPVALGGENSTENLRLLCRAHNQRRNIVPRSSGETDTQTEMPP
jgi:hypothetical protein